MGLHISLLVLSSHQEECKIFTKISVAPIPHSYACLWSLEPGTQKASFCHVNPNIAIVTDRVAFLGKGKICVIYQSLERRKVCKNPILCLTHEVRQYFWNTRHFVLYVTAFHKELTTSTTNIEQRSQVSISPTNMGPPLWSSFSPMVPQVVQSIF